MGVGPNRWAWVKDVMPRVSALVAEKRREWGDAHVTDCVARALAGEPGQFFAREGSVWIGTPWADDPVMADFLQARVTGAEAMICMRDPGAAA